MVAKEKTCTIMILDDEEDILVLYGDYLTKQGHRVLNTYVNGETILEDIDIERPRIFTL